MDKKEHRKKITGPWANIQKALWLFGLAVLAIKGWWWPGILILVGLSLILEAILMRFAPHAFGEENQVGTVGSDDAVESSLTSELPAATGMDHRVELLPPNCPKCGGPIKGHEVKWTGINTADCPYCGISLPMEKG